MSEKEAARRAWATVNKESGAAGNPVLAVSINGGGEVRAKIHEI